MITWLGKDKQRGTHHRGEEGVVLLRIDRFQQIAGPGVVAEVNLVVQPKEVKFYH